jgi:YesN/AraC family two-component response regulator
MVLIQTIAFALFEKMLNHENLIFFSEKRIKIFEELYNNLELGYSKSTTGYTSMLVWHFLGRFLFDDRFSASMRITEKDSVEKSIEFMKTHFYIKLSLKKICTHVCKSTSYFSLLFKSKTGYSPIEYFNHLKIQRSCQYLQFTTLRVNEIASKLGIEDPYYFSKLFTELMGSSPRRYRKTFMK